MPTRYARCFAPGVNFRSHDYIQMREEDARQMVADGLAELVNKGRDIRMFSRQIIKLRDRSCSWSHRLMVLVGEGNPTAIKMLEWIETVSPRWKMPVSIAPRSKANDYEIPMDARDDEMLKELRLGAA